MFLLSLNMNFKCLAKCSKVLLLSKLIFIKVSRKVFTEDGSKKCEFVLLSLSLNSKQMNTNAESFLGKTLGYVKKVSLWLFIVFL